MYPKLKFKINYKRDIETFFAFNNEANFDSGRNLKWAILKKYPQFKKYKQGNTLNINEDIVKKFVESIYLKNYCLIKKNLSIYQKNWVNIKRNFYLLVDELFYQRSWPKGKYIALPTIWGMYPKFLEDKVFQIPYKHKNKKYVSIIIAHEMLHFIFYDYFDKKYSKYKSNKYIFFVWNISEIFNNVIQNSPGWLKIFRIKSIPYPEHKKIIKKLQKIYYKKENIIVDDLIKNIIKALISNERY